MSWCFRSKPCHFSLFPLLVSFSAIFFLALSSFALGNRSRYPLQSLKSTEVSIDINGERRWAKEVAAQGTSTMVLAKDRTRRKDPLNKFNYYTGGWHLTDRHYWASAAFSALPPLLTAAIWFILYGFTLLITCICYCCCCQHSRSPRRFSQASHILALIIFVVFTLTSIGGCLFLYAGQEKFHTSSRNTLDYVVGVADKTLKNITTVSNYLESAKKIGIQGMTLPQDIQKKIVEIQTQADSASKQIYQQTHQIHRKINAAFDLVRDTLIGVSSIMLLLTIIGFLFTLCEAQCLVYLLCILGWILITATLIMAGVFLLIHNVLGDACVAMGEWVQNPTAHTTLDDILPCVDKATTQYILQQSKSVNQQVISLINTGITNVANNAFPPQVGPPLNYKQSGPKVPLLCTPYSPDLTDRACAPGEVKLSDAAQEWKKYTCQVGANKAICTTPGRLTPTYYDQLSVSANVSYSLYAYMPFLAELADCTFVRRTFDHITKIYCLGLQDNTEWVYIGLSFVSFSGMFSLFSWTLYMREKRSRGYRT